MLRPLGCRLDLQLDALEPVPQLDAHRLVIAQTVAVTEQPLADDRGIQSDARAQPREQLAGTEHGLHQG